MKNSPFTAFLLSALSQDDMQFIPGVFYKPFSLIPRCKSPQAMARLSVSQPLEQHGTQKDRRTHRQEDREQCRQLCKDRVGGRLLSGKESWFAQKEEDSSVRARPDSERLGGRRSGMDTGRRAGG